MKKTIIILVISILFIVIFFKNCGFEIGNVRFGKQDDFAGKFNADYQNSKFYSKIVFIFEAKIVKSVIGLALHQRRCLKSAAEC